ncbi:MAG TPA: prealbumin-like fold domain-containing protein, partial [Phytomonospora sp.]
MRASVALLLLVPTVGVQAATTTSAGAGVTAGFEIDGNTSVEGGGIDWTSPGIPAPTPDPVKTADDSNFTGGSKEFQNPSDWSEGTGTSTDQGDISDVYSHFVTGSSTWAFLGFRRIAQSGTMTFMAEFNQKANLPKEAGDSVQFRPDRSVNDLLLRFEQDGNGNFALTHAYKWTQSASGAFATGCFQVPGYATPSAYCPTPTSSAGFDGATGEGKLFAEGAVNLSSFDNVGDCRGAYGVMNVRSFAGDSEKSSLLDFVGGIGISVPPTCGKLVIEKRDQFQRLVPGATFRVTKNPVPGATGAAADQLVVKDGATPGIDTVADGVVTIDPAKPGTYTVEETATPAGYAPDTTVHTGVVVGSSGTSVATMEFTNKLFFKPLAVANQASGSYGVAYDWRVHKTVVGDASKTIDEGATATFGYRVELEALPEGPPTGKEVHGKVTVTNPNPSATHPSMRATIGIAGDLACHFLPSNAAVDVDPGTMGVQVDAAAGATSYDYACDPGAGALVGGQTTATVSWNQATYPQQDAHPGSVQAGATYAITVQPKIDEKASVTDAFDGGAAAPIGAASYTWSDVWNAP